MEREDHPVFLVLESVAFEIRQFSSEITLTGRVRADLKQKWITPAERFDMLIGPLYLEYQTMANDPDRDKLFQALLCKGRLFSLGHHSKKHVHFRKRTEMKYEVYLCNNTAM